MQEHLRRTGGLLSKHSDAVLAAGVMGVLITLIIPLPTPVLDVLLAFNFAYMLLLLMVVLSINTPLDLSTFPTLLLIGTLFRLALNVASTRLILLNAYAGRIIESFGEFVVGGQMVVGLIIFLIIVVIQFIVITKGAERISEVAARFTLDAMPGKQMSIDADLSAGLIDEREARAARNAIVREADFYGSMDGASKFVRGDAIAGIVIVLINIVGGIIIGLTKGMTVGQAARTYSLLTVGDGLVTQIPAVIMSTAAGILVTKTASDTALSKELGFQVFRNERAIAIAAVITFGFMLMPGLPALPFGVLGLVLSGVYVARRPGGETRPNKQGQEPEQSSTQPDEDQVIESLLQPDRVAVEVGYGLIRLIDPQKGGTLLERIKTLRKKFARELGIIMPKVHIVDNVELETNSYRIKLCGHKVAEGTVHPGYLMAMKPEGEVKGLAGIKAKEPSFGLDVVWIRRGDKEDAEARGFTVIDPESVFITHLSEVLRKHAHEILNRQDVQQLVDTVKKENPTIVNELVPDQMSLGKVQQVLQNLLSEGIPINNLAQILEALSVFAGQVQDPGRLTELVRRSLGRAICSRFADEEGRLNAISLDPRIEEEFRESIEEAGGEVRLNLPPRRLRQIIAAISEQAQAAFRVGADTVILTDAHARPHLRAVVSRVFPEIPVLSYDEVAEGIAVNNVGVISTEENQFAAADRAGSANPLA